MMTESMIEGWTKHRLIDDDDTSTAMYINHLNKRLKIKNIKTNEKILKQLFGFTI